MTVLEIQRRLLALGFDPGPVDGAWGPRTRSALKSFQRARALEPDGDPGPKSIAALRRDAEAGPSVPAEPLWLQEGGRRLGLRQGDARLKAFLASDGRTLGDPARSPWCGDFVETCLRIALPDEPQPANPYLARNWLRFGRACPEPATGAVAVFWRGARTGSSGHVGFVVGADRRFVSVLGGNQADSVSIARLARTRLLGCRWPSTIGFAGLKAPGETSGPISTDEA